MRALGQPMQRVLIYLWSPLVIFETAHSAHVDALVLPLLVLAGGFALRWIIVNAGQVSAIVHAASF